MLNQGLLFYHEICSLILFHNQTEISLSKTKLELLLASYGNGHQEMQPT